MSNDLEYNLIRLAVDGDHQAFEQLIIPYEKKVYNIALQMMRNEQDAYDAAQEVFIKVYKNLHKFNFEAAFSTWLHRLAMNTCIDVYRKRKRHRDHTSSMNQNEESDQPTKQYKDPKPSPEEALIKKELIQEVWQGLDHIKVEQRAILVYRDIQGMTYEEIAKIYECNLGTVKSRISRARNALKNQIIKNREQFP